MRRFTSIFQVKRSDADPPVHTTPSSSQLSSAFLSTFSPSKLHPEHPSKRRLDRAPPSSSSSASTTPSLRTPDDDGSNNMRITKSPTWKGFFKGKNPSQTLPPPSPAEWSQWHPDPPTLPRPAARSENVVDDSDADTASTSTSTSDSDLPLASALRVLSPAALSRARANLEAMTLNATYPHPSPSPLVNLPGAPLFPRSCNFASILHPKHTLEIQMHRAAILRRLNSSPVLSRSDEKSIFPLALRPQLASVGRPSPNLEEEIIADEKRIAKISRGLYQWAQRPCFEGRVVEWMPGESSFGEQVAWRPVIGNGQAVADLEFSDSLQVLAGLLDDVPFDPLHAAPSTTSEISDFASSTENQTVKPVSPVKIEYRMLSSPSSPSSLTARVSAPASTVTDAIPLPAPKRGVRFAEEHTEGPVPRGYASYVQKQKEDKAKFIQQENERRAQEAGHRAPVNDRRRESTTARQLAAERRALETERKALDEERRRWEKQRKAYEEELVARDAMKKRQYADELAAARVRREAQRNGSPVSTSVREVDLNRHGTDPLAYLRPTYDDSSRRMVSESSVPTRSSMRDPSSSPSRGRSAGSSPRPSPSPNSSASPSPSPIPNTFSSRPSSYVGASSSEDVRVRESRSAKTGRYTTISESSQHATSERSSIYGTLPRSHRTSTNAYPALNTAILPVPMIPIFPLEMPLLPPTPPFMMQQYGRSASPSNSYFSGYSTSPSSSSSPITSSPAELPHSHSSQGVTRPKQQRPQISNVRTIRGKVTPGPSSAPAAVPIGDHRMSQVRQVAPPFPSQYNQGWAAPAKHGPPSLVPASGQGGSGRRTVIL